MMDCQLLIETCGPLLDYLDRHGKTRVADVPDLNKDVVRLAFSHRLVGFSILVDGEWGWCVGSFDVAINDPKLFLRIESAGRQALSDWRLRRLAATPSAKLSPSEKDLVDAIREIGPDGDRSRKAFQEVVRPKRAEPPVAVFIERGVIVVDGQEHTAAAHWCKIVGLLLERAGDYATGTQMEKLPSCRGKKISREIRNLEEKIPALKSYLRHEGNKGYRMVFP